MKRKQPNFRFRSEYFLFLLPVFFVLHGFVENLSLIPVADALGLLVYYLLLSVAVATLAFFFFGSWRKACVFTTVLMAFHFFFGSVHDFLKSALGNSWLTSYTFLLSGSLLLLIAWVVFLKRTKRTFDRLTRYCNLLLLLLIGLDAALLAAKSFKTDVAAPLPKGLSICDTCTKPDIYLILSDGYAGKQELKELFQFDNSAFYDSLRKRGFQVAEDPRSNYNFTPFSVASILNFRYLPLKDPSHVAPETGMVTEMIKHNRLQQYLEACGYQTHNLSTFDLAGQPTLSVETFLPTKTKFITAQTFVSRLERDLFFNLVTRLHIRSVLKKVVYNSRANNELLYNQTLAAAGKTGRPKFVFTHLMMPHFPYFYNENGQPTAYDALFSLENKQQYLSYLKYTNKKFLVLIDGILRSSERPPLLVLMSDHGFRDYNDPNRQDYTFMNLCAVYNPGASINPIHQRRSNVNLFREILNTRFAQKLPLLKDTTIFLKD